MSSPIKKPAMRFRPVPPVLSSSCPAAGAAAPVVDVAPSLPLLKPKRLPIGYLPTLPVNVMGEVSLMYDELLDAKTNISEAEKALTVAFPREGPGSYPDKIRFTRPPVLELMEELRKETEGIAEKVARSTSRILMLSSKIKEYAPSSRCEVVAVGRLVDVGKAINRLPVDLGQMFVQEWEQKRDESRKKAIQEKNDKGNEKDKRDE